MKIKSLVLALTVFLTFSALAHAQVSITGMGMAGSSTPPDCDRSSIVEAEEAADQDATQQCTGAVKRISDYTTSCHGLAHGYAARAQAIAEYSCEPTES